MVVRGCVESSRQVLQRDCYSEAAPNMGAPGCHLSVYLCELILHASVLWAFSVKACLQGASPCLIRRPKPQASSASAAPLGTSCTSHSSLHPL